MADTFLGLFDPDSGEAERKFRLLNRRLVLFFQHSLITGPEDQSQEVFRRVLQKLPDSAVTHDDVVKFCFGVARNIIHECRRQRPMEELPPDEELERHSISRKPNPDPEQITLEAERSRRIRGCLQKLPTEDRDLIYIWDLEEKAERKVVTNRLGISANALRIRICRIKYKLRDCFELNKLR